MLAIRMQRTGRKGHASFRVVVQDSSQAPSSGKVVAHLGSHDPHTKATAIDKEKAGFYLTHGAQPSPRVAQLLKKEGVKLPSWVEKTTKKDSSIRNPEKLRRNRPPEAKTPAPEPVEVSEEAPAADTVNDSRAETTESVVADETTSAEANEPEAQPASDVEKSEPETAEPEAVAETPATEPEETAAPEA